MKRYVLVVTGSRDFLDHKRMLSELMEFEHQHRGRLVVAHGQARGADMIADRICMQHGIDLVRFPANWNAHGKAAGPLRNALMLDIAKPDFVLAFPLPGSKGTIDMIERARREHIPVKVVT